MDGNRGPKYQGPTMPRGMDLNDQTGFMQEHPDEPSNAKDYREQLKEEYEDSKIKAQLFDMSVDNDIAEYETLMTRALQQDVELRKELEVPGKGTLMIFVSWIEDYSDVPRGDEKRPGTPSGDDGETDGESADDDEDKSIKTPYDHMFANTGADEDQPEPDSGSSIEDIIDQQIRYEKEGIDKERKDPKQKQDDDTDETE